MSEGADQDAHVELLRSIPLFEGLATEDLVALASTVVARRYAAGELVFEQGDVGSAMYVVEGGHVNIHLPGEGSRRVSLKDVARGEYFGELALFDDKPRSASALVTSPATLLELTRKTLSEYLEKRPRAAMAILRTMSERLRMTNALISERATKNALEEIESNLTWADRLADKVAELNGSWLFVILISSTTALWVLLNIGGLARDLGLRSAVDPYPYILFNLVLTVCIALQGPLIVMSQNRKVLKDRASAQTDFHVNLKNEVNVETIMRELAEFRTELSARTSLLDEEDPPNSEESARR